MLRVSITGLGRVGAALVSNLLCHRRDVLEINILDPSPDVFGAFLDLGHAAALSPHRLLFGRQDLLAEADFVFHTAGHNSSHGESRNQVLEANRQIVGDIFSGITFSPQTCFIAISNPVDLMTYELARVTGAAPGKVMGTGTLLECQRMAFYLAEELGCPMQDIVVPVWGEHGDSQVPIFSQSLLRGESFPEELRPAFERAAEKTLHAAFSIRQTQPATFWGVARSATRIFEALQEESRSPLVLSLPLSSDWLHRMEGDIPLAMGVPALLGNREAHPMNGLPISRVELNALRHSYQQLRGLINVTD